MCFDISDDAVRYDDIDDDNGNEKEGGGGGLQ